MEVHLNKFFELLRALKIEREKFTADNYEKEEKTDGSPVTAVDTALNTAILHFLNREFPDDNVITEELAIPTLDAEKRTWFVDPLDGTKEFIKGLPEWAVQIGLVENNEVIFGIVAPLDLDKAYYAIKGQGAFISDLNQKTVVKLQCREVSDLTAVTLVVSRSRSDEKLDSFVSTHKIKSVKPLGSLGLKLGAIAEGSADLYILFSAQCSLWDICAPEIILKEAGGVVCYADGSKISYKPTSHMRIKDSLYACTKSLWPVVNPDKV